MAVINKDIAYMALPLSIRRGNPFPIDEYSVWYNMEELIGGSEERVLIETQWNVKDE